MTDRNEREILRAEASAAGDRALVNLIDGLAEDAVRCQLCDEVGTVTVATTTWESYRVCADCAAEFEAACAD